MMSSTINDRILVEKMKKMRARCLDARPAFKKIAARMLAATHRNFDNQKSPEGVAWKGLSEETRLRRGDDARILEDSGDLRQRCESKHTGTVALVTNSLPYARVHQKGYKKKNIPARPFLGLTKEGNQKYKKIVKDYLTDV
jgi:phage virion morphogenesis protein